MTNHNEIDPTKVASAALASVVLLMAALASSPVASADSVTDRCYDWMKIAKDSVTGEQMFCAAPGTPATKLSWQPWSNGAWGLLSIVGSAGSPCRAPSATFAQSSDGYVVWCVGPPMITRALLPGDQHTAPISAPLWSVYAP